MGEISSRLFKRAVRSIPGGVNSPVRAARAVEIDPLFINEARGCHVWDADGNKYIDFVSSWGPMILGHAPDEVIRAVEKALAGGTSFGAPTELEVLMAEDIVEMVPSIEMVRMVNSGTEATMSAIRLARGYSGRDVILKFDGCYHGHVDSLLVAAGSGMATLAIPGSPGVPADLVKHTISLPYNDIDRTAAAFREYGARIAAVIVEPIAGNMGVVIPEQAFLEGLRDLTKEHGALLIFDEVISGFRVAPGGAQELFGILPDLTCLGKIIGGGLPVGAFGGKREIMENMAPQGAVYQAGTLSGNPLAMSAGLATLRRLREPGLYDSLAQKGEIFFKGLEEAASAEGLDVTVNHVGSIGTLFFTPGPVYDFESAKAGNYGLFRKYYRSMLAQGIYLAPSPFEASFISTAHTEKILERTVSSARKAFSELSSS